MHGPCPGVRPPGHWMHERSAAAQRIGLSQAATSQALAELENLLERKLFDRHGRRIVLNAAGRQLLPAAAGPREWRRGAALVHFWTSSNMDLSQIV